MTGDFASAYSFMSAHDRSASARLVAAYSERSSGLRRSQSRRSR